MRLSQKTKAREGVGTELTQTKISGVNSPSLSVPLTAQLVENTAAAYRCRIVLLSRKQANRGALVWEQGDGPR